MYSTNVKCLFSMTSRTLMDATDFEPYILLSILPPEKTFALILIVQENIFSSQKSNSHNLQKKIQCRSSRD